MSIEKIWAREILDSRGNPTVEVDLYTAKGNGQGLPTAAMLALPSPGMGGSPGIPSGDGVLGQAHAPGAGRGGSSFSRGARIGRSLCASLVCDAQPGSALCVHRVCVCAPRVRAPRVLPAQLHFCGSTCARGTSVGRMRPLLVHPPPCVCPGRGGAGGSLRSTGGRRLDAAAGA